jgi:hypothetical protein
MNFLFSTSSRLALGSTQRPIQWVLGTLSRGVKLTTHLQLVPRSRRRGSIRPFPIRLLYVLLNQLNTGTTLLLLILTPPTAAFFLILVCETIGTAATPGLLCQPRVIMKMIVEKQMECRLTGETEVLLGNLPQRHFCPSQNPTWPDPVLNPGRRGKKPATNRLSYGAALLLLYSGSLQKINLSE